MNVWDSARDGRYDFVHYLLEKDPRHANLKDDNDVTPLCYAVLGNQPHIMKLLIEHGAKVNTPSKTSVPLVFAAMNGNVETTKILLDHKSKIKVLNKHGITPFHAAVTNGGANTETLLRMMLEAQPDCVNYTSPSIGSGLHAACSEGSPLEIVQLLVEHGGDPKLKIPDSGRTALHCAAGKGSHKVVDYLLTHGAAEVINSRDDQGLSALDLAALGGYTLVCEILMDAGAESDGSTQDQGMTPLFYAVQRTSNMETIFRLLDKGLRADHTTKPLVTPLHIAVSVPNCEEIVSLLIKHGASVNAQDCDNNTPAHYALLNGNEDGYLAMVKHNADMTLKNSRGQTPEELYIDFKSRRQKEEGDRMREADESKAADEPVQFDEGVQLKVCATCSKREPKPGTFKRCSKCKKVNYCSQGCQLKDWKLGHNKKCGA